MTDKPPPRGRKGYHHGNLREALVEATRALIATRGPAGFSFADVARHAGVSAAAPYRHFQNRDELIAETARRGFALFADRLESAASQHGANGLAALEAIAQAHLVFAREEPAYFAAMSDRTAVPEGDTALRDAEERALHVLRRAAERLCARLPVADRPPAHMMAYHIASLAHGIADRFLLSRGGILSPISPEELLESGLAVYLRGLGFLPED